MFYTKGPVPDVTDDPSTTSGTSVAPPPSLCPPAVQASHPRPSTGPSRTTQVSKTVRMRTGPLPPHLKKKVLASMENSRLSRAASIPPSTSNVETLTVAVSSVPTPGMSASPGEIHGPALEPSGPTELSTFPDADVFDTSMDDLEPPATSPRVATDDFTGEVIVVDHDSTVIVPTIPQTGMFPRLGINSLIETDPPALLYKDQDVRPDWLISAVREFLRYIPYYGNLGKVIDQFLLQEARLGYPTLV